MNPKLVRWRPPPRRKMGRPAGIGFRARLAAAGTHANHCPTDGAPAMSAKTRTMTATMMPGTMTAG